MSVTPTEHPEVSSTTAVTTFVSYAQNHEDVVLWRVLGHVPDGRYVDVGAADPVTDSVTAAFVERGWHGVDIEPVPAYADALRRARPQNTVVECGIGDAPGIATLTVIDGTGWSTFDEHAASVAVETARRGSTIEVEVRTLDQVLDEIGLDGADIHFLKIDVEGFERAVLQGFTLSRWAPWVVVVEATAPGSTVQTHAEWEHLLIDADYRFCLFDGLNRFYASPGHPELVSVLSYPACTFDQPFEQRHVTAVREESALRAVEVERRQDAIAEAHVEIDRLAVEADRLRELVIERAEAADALERRCAELANERAEAVDALERRCAELGNELHLFALDNVRWRQEALVARARTAEIGRLAHEFHVGRSQAESAFSAAMGQIGRLETELAAMSATVSWRVTTPLRTVRRVWPRPPVASKVIDVTAVDTVGDGAADTDDRAGGPLAADRAERLTGLLLRRFARAARLLSGLAPDALVESPLDALAAGFEASDADDMAKAWLGWVAATGRYPDEDTARSEARVLRREGAAAYVQRLTGAFEASIQRGEAREVDLDVIVDGVVIDVTHTAQHDLQTGIQRVVRETCSRWLEHDEAVLVFWDYASNTLRRLDDGEVERMRHWRDHLPTVGGTQMSVRTFDAAPVDVVVPWSSVLLLPELTAEPARTGGYRALSQAHVLRGISMIGYDIIPVTAAETVTEAMSHVFSLYLSMVKHATRLSAISEAAGGDFSAFNGALVSQGLRGPEVRAHLLPPSPTECTADELEQVRRALDLGALPMVLVVGSHEPRKNHLTVLDAAERLWADGALFDLVFIGGSGWRSEPFDREIERLEALGRTVRVRKRATETELWGAYRLARFTVFPSLLEGYGLPIVESIACGTPVITTDYGSMAEVAAEGGALLVDPYDVEGLAERMRSLLDDRELLERLRVEAAQRTFPTWDHYAADVWQFLVAEVRSDA